MKEKIIYDKNGIPLEVQRAEAPMAKRGNQVDFVDFQTLVKFAMSKVNLLPKDQQNLYNSFDTKLTAYKQSEVRDIVKKFKTEANQEKIVDVSKQLYATSTQYRRLINHFSGMPKFSPVITPTVDLESQSRVTMEKIKKQYQNIGTDIRKMNMAFNFRKAYKLALIEDVLFGWVHETDDSFFIQPFDYRICRISSIEDGVYNFAVDMMAIQSDETQLQFLPNEVNKIYNKWKKKKAKNSQISQWEEMPSQTTICIKVSDEMIETFPFFAGVFDSIYDVEAFKQLRKDSAELANYMAIVQKLPIRESNDNNDFTIDAQMYTYFNNVVQSVVPEQVGVFTTPMDIDTVKFDNTKAGDDGVEKATKNVWNDSGISSVLFNTEAASTTQGLASSIKTDEEIVFATMTQFELWVNRYMKFKYKKQLMFNVSLLPITVFNQKEMFEMYLSAGQYGIPIKSHISAIVGLEPIEVMSMAYLENEVLKMHETFIPLQSSHTQSGEEVRDEKDADGIAKKVDDKGGREKLPATERSAETERNDTKPSASPS